jgi:predicted transcriptional regulator
MTVTEIYILKETKPLKLEDKLEKAVQLLEDSGYSHLAVVRKGVYEGTISLKQAEERTDLSTKIGDIRSLLNPVYVLNNMDWFDVLQVFATNNCNALPVIDKEKNYLGYYEIEDFLGLFRQTPFLHENGMTLIISKGVNDYSFSEIAQIIESNNATLFGAFVSAIDQEMAEIILKISLHDISNTIQTFRRYGYHIINEIHEDRYLQYLKERADYLEKYLNI